MAQQVLLQHPALAAAQAQATLARLQLGRLEADRRPDPTVALRFAQERGGAEQVLGLTVAIPFGSALRDQRVQAGAAAWSAAQAQVRALQAQLAADADRIAAAPAQASHVAGRLQAAAQAAQTSARLTERAQAAGEATLAELLQQHRQAGDAALAAALAQVDALEAQARLALALQQLLPAPAPSATQPAP